MKAGTMVLLVGAVAAGVYFLFRKGGTGMAALQTGQFVAGSDGRAYVVKDRPESSWDLTILGGSINLANSQQVIVPATPLDFVSLVGL